MVHTLFPEREHFRYGPLRSGYTALCEAVERANKGLIDADLGSGVIKLRIARPGAGKSGGYRSILLFRKDERAFFVYGFAKNALDNIDADEVALFKKMAKHVLSLTDAQLHHFISNGQFEELASTGLTPNDQEIPQ